MTTLREHKGWQFVKDELMGTTTIINDYINFMRNWNTGTDAQEEIELISAMSDDEFLIYCNNEIPLPF